MIGLEWGGVILVIGGLTIYVFYSFYQSTFRSINMHPEEKGFSFGQFIGYYYTGQRNHWTSLFFKFPKSIKRFNQYVGKMMTPALSYAGIISTLMWVLIKIENPIYLSIHSPSLIYLVLIGGVIIIVTKKFRNEYKRYSKG